MKNNSFCLLNAKNRCSKHSYVILTMLICCLMLAVAGSNSFARPYLIEYTWGSHSSPIEAVKNRAFIDTLPFDGIVVRGELCGTRLMDKDFTVGNRIGRPGIADGVWTYEQCIAGFSPLANSDGHRMSDYFKKTKHNFPLVQFRVNAGLFSDKDWAWVLESFKNFAKASKDVGFEGIMLDDEINSNTTPGYWNYLGTDEKSVNQLYFAGRTLTECHLQARLRGKQVMDAITSEFPGAVVIVLHGPYRSSWVSNAARNSNQIPKPPTLVNHCLGIYCVDNLMDGSFAAGLIESSGLQKTLPHSLVVDGGELYDFRDPAVFKDNYEWRKNGILNPEIGKSIYPTHPVRFLDDPLRAIWSKSISIGYGLYDKERPYDAATRKFGKWQARTDMNDVRNNVATALRIADNYVWHYTEGFDWFADPANTEKIPANAKEKAPATKEWINAIRQGMLDAEIGTAKDSK